MDLKNFMVGNDEKTIDQINTIANSPAYKDSKIRIMADAHSGIGAVIGSTMTFTDKICPATVGVDISCRVTAFNLPYVGHFDEVELKRLDKVIHNVVPTGFNVNDRERKLSVFFPYEKIRCWDSLKNHDRLRRSMGTLGGSNHYIELDWDEDTLSAWLVIHSGSRNLGKQIAEYYQEKAIAVRDRRIETRKRICEDTIRSLRELGQFDLIQHEIDIRNRDIAEEPENDLCYLTGADLEDYLHDAKLCDEWSFNNHATMFEAIARGMNWPGFEYYSSSENAEFRLITCTHNYVDVNNKIVRKGAISAQKDELGLIPLNMRDGILVVRGKGNPDYNYSLPHGAGRIMSRGEACREIRLADFQEAMEGIYTSSIGESTLDESPMVYKDTNAIIAAIGDNAEIIGHWKPLYNFKNHKE